MFHALPSYLFVLFLTAAISIYDLKALKRPNSLENVLGGKPFYYTWLHFSLLSTELRICQHSSTFSTSKRTAAFPLPVLGGPAPSSAPRTELSFLHEEQHLHSASTFPLEKSPQQRNTSLEAGRNGNIEEHQPQMNSSVGHHTRPRIRNSMRIMKEELSQPRRHRTGWSEGWEEASLRSHDSAETSSMKKESAGGNRIQVSKGLVQSE